MDTPKCTQSKNIFGQRMSACRGPQFHILDSDDPDISSNCGAHNCFHHVYDSGEDEFVVWVRNIKARECAG